jgi:hypothetical protein
MRITIVLMLLPIVALLEAEPAFPQGYTVQGTATWHYSTPEQYSHCLNAWNRPLTGAYARYCRAYVEICHQQGRYRFTWGEHVPYQVRCY